MPHPFKRFAIRPPRNRCCLCGRFVGERFTGYERDRMSERGRLWCDLCIRRNERGRP